MAPSSSYNQPEPNKYTVSQFVACTNQILETAYPSVLVEGEVSSFKINQGKWVFFDLKDEECSVSCFMPLHQLGIPLEDGMKVVVRARAGLTKWGKFSLTVTQISPVGEGSIKKAFEALKKKLEKEGLFAKSRKRPLPENLTKIGVISSTGAAGYADFCKILNARWGGLEVQTCHTQVQGLDAPAQIIRALKYLNERSEVQLIAIIRGGGSADDLSCFNDEDLARAIAASKIPVITGIGHEVDESLADLVADLRASTPSNVAELVTPDKNAIRARAEHDIKTARSRVCQALIVAYNSVQDYKEKLRDNAENRLIQAELHVAEQVRQLNRITSNHLNSLEAHLNDQTRQLSRAVSGALVRLEVKTNDDLSEIRRALRTKLEAAAQKAENSRRILESFNPDLVLKQGYSIIAGKLAPGSVVKITTLKQTATAEIKLVKERN